MCNAYELGGQVGSYPGFLRAEAIRVLEKSLRKGLIRRTDSAPVVLDENQVLEMSWGFRRPRLGVINNSRCDKLEGPMWRDAYAARRCLIPLSWYYEWQGPKGQKETFRFVREGGELLWMAGIWEDSSEFGRCFSMITTAASKSVLPIHHRMPAALREEQLASYLGGETIRFGRDFAEVVPEKCENPLVRKPTGSVQTDLFDKNC